MTSNPNEQRIADVVPIGTAAARALAASSVHGSPEWWDARDAEIAATRARESAAAEHADVEAALAQLATNGFPARALAVCRDGFGATQATAALVGLKPGIVVLSGPKGCGKTVAATWLAVQTARATKQPSTFLRASAFLAAGRFDREARALWAGASRLVLDDLGMEYADAKGSFLADLDELIDVFYADLRTLVITTNCSLDVFSERYGERIRDRLRESTRWFELDGESMRSPGGAR